MSKPNHTIEPAGFGDAQAIFALIRRHPEELVPRPLTDIFQNIDRFLVCRDGDTLAGAVSWQILPEIGASSHPTVEIQSLAVQPGCRRKGIGRALVNAALARVRTLQPSQVIVLTFHPGFFAGLGFREVPKTSLMHKIYMGCVNCAKYDSPFTCPEVAMTLDLKD